MKSAYPLGNQCLPKWCGRILLLPPTSQVLGAVLARHVPGLKQSKCGREGARVPVYILPPPADMRVAFLKANSGYAFPAEVKDYDLDDMSPKVVAMPSRPRLAA